MAQGTTYGLTGVASAPNSSTTLLAANASFTGQWVDISKYASLVVSTLADKDGLLIIQFSSDAITAQSTLSFNVLANINEVHRVSITRRYARVIFTNGPQNQGNFNLQALVGFQTLINASLNAVISQDADANVVRTIDSEIDIANSKYVGYSITNKFGFNPDVDTGVQEDIWGKGGLYTGFPVTAGETITIVSTSTDDTAAGVGARTIRITGLDANYNVQSETITLNGTTPATGALTFTRVHTAFVLTSGVGNTAFNVGTITVRHTTTVANVFLVILPGHNQSHCSAFTIPAGFTGYLRKICVEVGAATSISTSAVDYVVFIQDTGKLTAPRIRRPGSTYYGAANIDNIYGGVQLVEKTDLIIRVTTVSNNNTAVSACYDLLLVKN